MDALAETILERMLQARGYSLEIDTQPKEGQFFRYMYAVQGEKRIKLCSTSSYYVQSGIEYLPGFLDKQLEVV